MKVAAGCFGCLALVFLLVLAVFSVPLFLDSDNWEGPLVIIADSAQTMRGVGGSCCCLSALGFVICLALGMRGGNPEAEE